MDNNELLSDEMNIGNFAKPRLAAVSSRKATQIAKRYVSALITYYDGFYSELLSQEENELIQEECMKIALKLFDGENENETNEIVRKVLSK